MEMIAFIIAAFFAVNMGAPSFAGSFATAYGSKVIDRKKAGFLFLVCALAGALWFGGPVSETLSKGIIPAELMTLQATLIILFSATLSLFVANVMHIPQSTSLSTLASILGVGLFHHQINAGKIYYLLACWIISTIISFWVIYAITRYIYPPQHRNFWIYEKVVQHRERLKKIVILTSCYKAFAQGTNNVANAVGPLFGAGLIGLAEGLLLMGLFFGAGAFGFSGPLRTSSEKIIPLGLLTATIINLVSGTITIIASKMGIPFPTVIVYTVSIFAVGSIKDGMEMMLENPVTRKTLFTWIINPVITFGVSFLLANIFLIRI